jgi:hypothetical protein
MATSLLRSKSAGAFVFAVSIAVAVICGLLYWHEQPPMQLLSGLAYPAAELAGVMLATAAVVGIALWKIADWGIHGESNTVLQTEFNFDAGRLRNTLHQDLGQRIAQTVAAAQKGTLAEPLSTAVEKIVADWNGEPKLFDVVKYDLDLLNNRINSEYSGVSEKVGWLVTSQAFLVTGFMALLNNTAIGGVERFLLLLGIAAIGLSGSISLSVGIFFGHAWCEFMKATREAVEKEAYEKFHIPRTGVPVQYGAHRYGHFATKFLASMAVAGWITIAALVMTDKLEVVHPPPAATQTQGPPPSR